MIAFNVPDDREALEKAVKLYGGAVKESHYIPELLMNPKADRKCVVTMFKRLMKLGFTPVINIPAFNKCFENFPIKGLDGVTYPVIDPSYTTKTFLRSVGITKEPGDEEILTLKTDDPTVLNIRQNIIVTGLIERVINTNTNTYSGKRTAEFDDRVKVLYALPLWRRGEKYGNNYLTAYLVGLVKRGSNNIFNRVVFVSMNNGDGYIEMFVGNALNWLPEEVASNWRRAQKSNAKWVIARVKLENLARKNWLDKVDVFAGRYENISDKEFILRPSKVKFGTVNSIVGKVVVKKE